MEGRESSNNSTYEVLLPVNNECWNHLEKEKLKLGPSLLFVVCFLAVSSCLFNLSSLRVNSISPFREVPGPQYLRDQPPSLLERLLPARTFRSSCLVGAGQ